MMEQYRRIKAGLPPGVLLLFRLGDFYEMFFEDAKEAAPLLDIALTRRNGVPMCGVPYHAVDVYLGKLIKAGRKAAICEQMEDPQTARGIVRREITRVVTPGTVTEANILEADRHNYLAGLCYDEGHFGLAVLDHSTGLFWGEELPTADTLCDRLRTLAPAECVVPADQSQNGPLAAVLSALADVQVTRCEDWLFSYEAAYDRLVRHFGVHSLEGFGCEGRAPIVGAAGGVLYYVCEELHRQAGHINSFQIKNPTDYLVIDEATCANLDLAPLKGRAKTANLLDILDATQTPMGRRKLHDWLLQPPAKLEPIVRRHDAVEALCKDRGLLRELMKALSEIRDLERLIVRIGSGSGNARDMVALGKSLERLPTVKKLLENHPTPMLRELAAAILPLPEVAARIARALVDEPPFTIKDGGVIRPGYSAELDELRHVGSDGRQWLAEYQAREQERTGIKTLKVRHNKIFGYYIEVSKGQAGNVPADYLRKQTLVNAERFITPELKEYEQKIMGAEERAVALEYELFLELRAEVIKHTRAIQTTAEAIAQLDALASLADRALAFNYVRPRLTTGDAIIIKEGRHPVVEQMPNAERFVPNDARLDCRENQIIIITGPNMAGKSTYIRQVALIVIMAHMGSFVPATEAEIALVDRVFTRVGASDDLARGRSTFLVEMQETANILNNATPRSLIILDEIGRGTSTFDGISIAWAVAEHLHNNPRVKAKTLFATHYHELTDLALTLPGVKNYNIQVREKGDQIVFLRRIVPGGADKSYGIQVARLAGLPLEVIDRAKEILANLEEGEFGDAGQPKIARRRFRKEREEQAQAQLRLFEQTEC